MYSMKVGFYVFYDLEHAACVALAALKFSSGICC
jgi:hypothetical protein